MALGEKLGPSPQSCLRDGGWLREAGTGSAGRPFPLPKGVARIQAQDDNRLGSALGPWALGWGRFWGAEAAAR